MSKNVMGGGPSKELIKKAFVAFLLLTFVFQTGIAQALTGTDVSASEQTGASQAFSSENSSTTELSSISTTPENLTSSVAPSTSENPVNADPLPADCPFAVQDNTSGATSTYGWTPPTSTAPGALTITSGNVTISNKQGLKTVDARIEIAPSSADELTVTLDSVSIEGAETWSTTGWLNYLNIHKKNVASDNYDSHIALLLQNENTIVSKKANVEPCHVANGNNNFHNYVSISNASLFDEGSLNLIASPSDSARGISCAFPINNADVSFLSGKITCINNSRNIPSTSGTHISALDVNRDYQGVKCDVPLFLNGGSLVLSTPFAPMGEGYALQVTCAVPDIAVLKISKGSLITRDCNYGAFSYGAGGVIEQTGGTVSLRGREAGLALLDMGAPAGESMFVSYVQKDGYLEASSIPKEVSFDGDPFPLVEPDHQGGLYYKGEGLDKNMPDATITGNVTFNTDVDLPASVTITPGSKLVVEKDVAVKPDYEAYGNNPIEILVDPGAEIENHGGTIDPVLLSARVLIFDANGGTFENGTTTTLEVAATDPTIALPAQEPTRPGFRFLGYFTAPEGGTEVNSMTPLPAISMTYYAHWQGAPADASGLPATGDDTAMALTKPFIVISLLGLFGVALSIRLGKHSEK